MPFYDYKCSQCEHKWSTSHSIKEVVKECPSCKSDLVKKVFGNFGNQKPIEENDPKLEQRVYKWMTSQKEELQRMKDEYRENSLKDLEQ